MGKKTVLIVEDDPVLNLMFVRYFEKLGFKTEGKLVHSNAAIELTKKLNPDLIVMDILLIGNSDGIETMQEIRKFSDVSVIFASAYDIEKYNQRAEEIGCLAFLQKPVKFNDLKEIVSKHFPVA